MVLLRKHLPGLMLTLGLAGCCGLSGGGSNLTCGSLPVPGWNAPLCQRGVDPCQSSCGACPCCGVPASCHQPPTPGCDGGCGSPPGGAPVPKTPPPAPPPPYEAPPAPINVTPSQPPPTIPYQKPPKALEPEPVPSEPGTDVPEAPLSSTSINWQPIVRRRPLLVSHEEYQQKTGSQPTTLSQVPYTAQPRPLNLGAAEPALPVLPPSSGPSAASPVSPMPVVQPLVIQPAEFVPPLQVR